MIKVNLLPTEYRKAEATPLKQFFATVGAVVFAALAVVVWGFVHFRALQPAVRQLEQLKDDVASQANEVDTSKKLAAQLAEYQGRFKKIDEVAAGRLVWSRKLDEVWEVLVNPRMGRYEVWIDTFSASLVGGGRDMKVGGTVTFAGTSAGSQMFRLADFHKDLKESDFFKDCMEITPPYGTRKPLEGNDREPKEGWSFSFILTLKPLPDLYKDRAEAAMKEEQ